MVESASKIIPLVYRYTEDITPNEQHTNRHTRNSRKFEKTSPSVPVVHVFFREGALQTCKPRAGLSPATCGQRRCRCYTIWTQESSP